MKPSSLQTAVAVSQVKTEKGQFENCFASGLDLSEFNTHETTTTTTTITSASHALLLVKTKEKERLDQQVADDEEMSRLVKKQIDGLAQSAAVKAEENGNMRVPKPNGFSSLTNNASSMLNGVGGVMDALVGMHSIDKQDERYQSLKNKRPAKKTQKSKHSPRQQTKRK